MQRSRSPALVCLKNVETSHDQSATREGVPEPKFMVSNGSLQAGCPLLALWVVGPYGLAVEQRYSAPASRMP